MRRIFLYSLSFLTLMLTACSDSNVAESFTASINGHLLSISEKNLQFPAEGSTKNANVLSSATPWRFYGNPHWLVVTPLSGKDSQKIDFTATPNMSSDTIRSNIFYLMSTDEAWPYQDAIAVTQSRASATLEVEQTYLNFTGSASTKRVGVKTNTDYKLSVDVDWISLSKDGTDMIVSIEENLTDASRQAEITLAGTMVQVVRVVQQAANITGSTETIEFSSKGGTLTYSFEPETSWTATATADWIIVSPKAGSVDVKEISIATLPNNSPDNRTDYVYLNIGGHQKLQIPVYQENGISIKVFPSSLHFASGSNSKSITITSNTSWEVVSAPDWITPSSTSGKDNQDITLTASENPNFSTRSGEVKIGRKGQTYGAIVSVTQEGMTLSADTEILQFSDKSSSQNVKITTPGTWTATTKDDWIRVSPSSGTSSYFTVSVEENTTDEERVGEIELWVGNIHTTIIVKQQGKYFNLQYNEQSLPSTGGILSLSINTNEQWEITDVDNDSWISFDSKSGSGTQDIFIRIADNASMHERQGSFVVTPANSKPIKLSVRQSGRYLTIDRTNLDFFSKGGTQKIVVDTDGSFEPQCSASWVTATKGEGNTVDVKVSQNTTTSSRTATLKIVMKGLANGETYSQPITIRQSSISDVIDFYDYDEDDDWNPTNHNNTSFIINGVSFTMVFVEGGTFTMGATSEQVTDPNEKPAHQVTLSSFYIGETEVTQALWYAVMGAEPSSDYSWTSAYGLGDEYPAYYISWNECQTFIQKLNILTDKQFRLPTEAEWEYAARGGNKSKGYKYSGSNNIEDVAWYGDNSGGNTHPVKTKLPNELGLYDTSGNVWEWCQDWFGTNIRMSCGGSHVNDAENCLVAGRGGNYPDARNRGNGFRLALSE